MGCMIDWLTVRVPCQDAYKVDGGRVVGILPDGSIEWSIEKRLQVVGSHSSKVQARRCGSTMLEVSGNFSKFLQGHNLFGSPDVGLLVKRAVPAVVERLGLTLSGTDVCSLELGCYEATRVDVTRMYSIGTNDTVRQFLTAVVPVAHARQQRTSLSGSTIYVGQHSKRIALKLYNKFEEMQVRGHRLPESMPAEYHEALHAYAEGKVRVELTLRSKELQERNLRSGYNWNPEKAEALLDERIGVLEMNDTMKLSDEVRAGLPARLVAVYCAWRAGEDLRSMYSKAQFYRYRSQLLVYGVDIAHVRPREVVAETQYLLGQPLKSFLVGQGAEPPTWAVGTDLLVS